MGGHGHGTAAHPRKWAQRGIFILLALFALMTHNMTHPDKASATGVSPAAITVYGQGNYTSSSADAGTDGLSAPHAVAVDSSGDLYIADTGNNRVLYFPTGSTTATRVSGQGSQGTDFTDHSASAGSTSLNQPGGVALDSNDNLYVADTGNNRVLYFPSGETTATGVYGQGGSFTDGTTNNGGLSASSLDAPAGLVTSQWTGAGWNLTITSTQLKTLTGKTLPTTATRITAVDAACAPASSCISATNTLSYPLAVPAGSTAPTPVKFFNAASGSGQGHLQLTVTLSTTVPADSYKGTYMNTITPAINSGS